MEKGTKQQSVEIYPLPFNNDDPTNTQLDNNPNTHEIILYNQFQKQNYQLHLSC